MSERAPGGPDAMEVTGSAGAEGHNEVGELISEPSIEHVMPSAAADDATTNAIGALAVGASADTGDDGASDWGEGESVSVDHGSDGWGGDSDGWGGSDSGDGGGDAAGI